MFSSNIIERHQALNDLVTLNATNTYFLAVAALMVVCYFLKDWI